MFVMNFGLFLVCIPAGGVGPVVRKFRLGAPDAMSDR